MRTRPLIEIYEWTQINDSISVMIKTVGDYEYDGFYGVDVVDEEKQQHPIQDVFNTLKDAKKRYKQLVREYKQKFGDKK